jgi:hypothetical protein
MQNNEPQQNENQQGGNRLRDIIVIAVIALVAGVVGFLASDLNLGPETSIEQLQPEFDNYRILDGDDRFINALRNAIGSVPLVDVHPVLEQTANFGTDVMQCMQVEGTFDVRILIHQDFVSTPNAGASIILNQTRFLPDLKTCLEQRVQPVVEAQDFGGQSIEQYPEFGICRDVGSFYYEPDGNTYIYGFVALGENMLSTENVTIFSIADGVTVGEDTIIGVGDRVQVDICEQYMQYFSNPIAEPADNS